MNVGGGVHVIVVKDNCFVVVRGFVVRVYLCCKVRWERGVDAFYLEFKETPGVGVYGLAACCSKPHGLFNVGFLRAAIVCCRRQ